MELYVDGCCNAHIGACSSVVDAHGNDLIGPNADLLDGIDFLKEFIVKNHIVNGRVRRIYEVMFTDVTTQQNNGAELVAMCLGLIIGIQNGYTCIYSDSTLIVDHWTKKVSKTIKDEFKKDIQSYAVHLRNEFEKRGGQVKHVPGDRNPADLGYHR